MRTVSVLAAALLASGCSQLAWKAADQAAFYRVPNRPAPAVEVPDGFRAVVVAEGFNYPSSIAWDDRGDLYVLESHTIPVPLLAPKVLRVARGRIERVRLAGPAAPRGKSAVGLTFHDGWLYLSHEEADGGFGVYRVRPAGGAVEPVLRGLPAQGDHDVNYLVFGGDGTLYFGLGSATNSGVVSSHDPVNQKWLEQHPEMADIPCRDLVLAGGAFADDNALTRAKGDRATTGAFQPYGRSDARRVAGRVPCSTAVFRLRPGATAPELLAWGFRNPVAVALDAAGTLFVGMHGADIRGTRPVLNDPDAIYRVREGAWYGWPDYSAALDPVTTQRHQPPREYLAEGQTALEAVIDREGSGLPAPDRSLLVATTEPHAALGGMTFVPEGGPFARWAGQLLLSEMGDFKPVTNPVTPEERAGFQIERVDVRSGERSVFARNRGGGDSAQPASTLDLSDGFERPVDVKVGPDGLVYVLDYGPLIISAKGQKAFPKTGKVFRIEPVPAEPAR